MTIRDICRATSIGVAAGVLGSVLGGAALNIYVAGLLTCSAALWCAQ